MKENNSESCEKKMINSKLDFICVTKAICYEKICVGSCSDVVGLFKESPGEK